MRKAIVSLFAVILSAGCGTTGEVDGDLYPSDEAPAQGGFAGSDSAEADGGEYIAPGAQLGTGGTGGWSRVPGLSADSGALEDACAGSAGEGAGEEDSGSVGNPGRDSGSSVDVDGGGAAGEGGAAGDDAGSGECADHSDCGDFRACVNGSCVSCDGIDLPEACEPEVQLTCTDDKVLVCHHPHGSDEDFHEICVSKKAWLMAHSNHDKDHLGNCR